VVGLAQGEDDRGQRQGEPLEGPEDSHRQTPAQLHGHDVVLADDHERAQSDGRAEQREAGEPAMGLDVGPVTRAGLPLVEVLLGQVRDDAHRHPQRPPGADGHDDDAERCQGRQGDPHDGDGDEQDDHQPEDRQPGGSRAQRVPSGVSHHGVGHLGHGLRR